MEPRWAAPLAQANDIRLKRAQLKRDLRDGTIAFDEVLFDPPDWLENCPIADILVAMPYIGKSKVSTALSATHMSWSRTFGGTPEAQRQRLDRWMRERHPTHYPTRTPA